MFATQEQLEKAFAYDDLQWRLAQLHKLGQELKSAEQTISVHSQDWDRGFMEAKHMIGEWINRMTGPVIQ